MRHYYTAMLLYGRRTPHQGPAVTHIVIPRHLVFYPYNWRHIWLCKIYLIFPLLSEQSSGITGSVFIIYPLAIPGWKIYGRIYNQALVVVAQMLLDYIGVRSECIIGSSCINWTCALSINTLSLISYNLTRVLERRPFITHLVYVNKQSEMGVYCRRCNGLLTYSHSVQSIYSGPLRLT